MPSHKPFRARRRWSKKTPVRQGILEFIGVKHSVRLHIDERLKKASLVRLGRKSFVRLKRWRENRSNQHPLVRAKMGKVRDASVGFQIGLEFKWRNNTNPELPSRSIPRCDQFLDLIFFSHTKPRGPRAPAAGMIALTGSAYIVSGGPHLAESHDTDSLS